MNIETILAHVAEFGGIKDPHGASHLPIYNTATFDLKKQSGDKIYDYTRTDNPTRDALEKVFTIAENGAGCVCTHTGIASVALLFETVLKSGDHILLENDCYGGTFRLSKIYTEKHVIKVHFADFTNTTEIENILKNYPIKLTLCESPTNPGMKVIDLAAISQLSKKYNSLFGVDNSVATFMSQKPIELGADFSLFSTTKFISGHGSVIAGAIVAKEIEWADKLHYFANAGGRSQNPFDVFLISLGLPTLKIRMKAQEEKTFEIISFLQTLGEIKAINFPGLENHPNHILAKKQMCIFPAIFTAEFVSTELAEKFIAGSKLFGEKASFGAADSRVEIPAKISHASFSDSELAKIGISRSTVRFSIGLENTDDLIADIKQALEN